MSVQNESVRALAIATFEEELERARGAGMKARLRAVNEACENLVNNNGTPNPANVAGWVATNRSAAAVSKQTIYNKRTAKDGTTIDNPFSKIITAWANVAQDRAVGKRGAPKAAALETGSYITSKDLEKIGDLVVRHQVAIMLGQFRQLKNQAEMRNAIKDMPPIPSLPGPPENADAITYDLALNEDELEALADFIKGASAERRGIEFNDVGTVMAKRVNNGKALSKPGFVDAIRKILQSYDASTLEND